MARYFGLPLLLITLFMVGCGEKAATQEEAQQGMDTMGESYGSDADLGTGGAPGTGDAPAAAEDAAN